MIEAYIDEAGTHDQAKIVVMAGALSSYKRWRKFDRQWDRTLNSVDGLNPPGERRTFHATDCLGVEGYRDFKGWPKTQRDALVEKLIPIVRQRAIFTFSAAFALEDYNSIVPEWIRRKWVHPYYLAMFHIVNLLKVNRAKFPFPHDEKIAFVFAHKPKFVGLLTELYEDLSNTEAVGDILGKMDPYGSPKENIPIQAADLICYLTRTFWEKEYFQPQTASRRTLALLRLLIPEYGDNLEPHFLGRDALEAFVKAYTETYEQEGEWGWNSKRRR